MKALVVAPRADDETFGAGATMAPMGTEGHEVTVCVMTGHGEDGPHPLWSRIAWDALRGAGAEAMEVLGAAGEAIGIDRYLKANTVKKRTISLLNQGLMHYGALQKMKLDMLEPLMAKFGELLRGHAVFREVFGLT